MTLTVTGNPAELFAALAKAQAEMTVAEYDSNNTYFESKYASLAAVIEATRPVLSKHGISITQHPRVQDGLVIVTTMVAHASGAYMTSELALRPAKNDAHSVGSAITYAKRYAWSAAAGIAADDDDDGNAAVSLPPAPPPTHVRPQATRPDHRQSPLTDEDRCNMGWDRLLKPDGQHREEALNLALDLGAHEVAVNYAPGDKSLPHGKRILAMLRAISEGKDYRVFLRADGDSSEDDRAHA